MRDQLKLLEVLQAFDAQIQELNNSLKAIPTKLEATQNDLARVETLLANEKAQLAEAQRYYEEQRANLAADEGHVSAAKNKMGAVRNTREYAAAQREIDQTRDQMASREAEIGKLAEVAEAKAKVLAEREKGVQELREGVEKDAEVARAKMADLEGKIAEIRTERDKVAKDVKPDVLKRYSIIRMRRGIALATVANGACQGCNMNIPPQLYITIQRGASIESCPYCHRIIYWEGVMKDPADDAGKSGAA